MTALYRSAEIITTNAKIFVQSMAMQIMYSTCLIIWIIIVRWSKKLWLKVLFTDLLWKKSTTD